MKEMYMGFRSAFTTQHYAIEWPQWFRDKYFGSINFPGVDGGPLNSAIGGKAHTKWRDLHLDIQKSINWNDGPPSFVLVYLHDCGGITRCQIERDAILWSEPESWRNARGITHWFCRGCSDAQAPEPAQVDAENST